MKLKDKDITPKYVNDKLESIVVALMDTIVEQEDRLKNIETGEEEIVFNLKRWCEERGYDHSGMVAASKKRGSWKKKMTKHGMKEYYCVHRTSYGYEIEECNFK